MTNWIPPEIAYHFQDKGREACLKTKHVCPHWVDKEIMKDLSSLDKKDKGNRVSRYEKQCHELVLIYRPDVHRLSMTCNNLDHTKPNRCEFQNIEACELILKEMEEENNYRPQAQYLGVLPSILKVNDFKIAGEESKPNKFTRFTIKDD